MRYEKEQIIMIMTVISTAFITTFTGSALNLAVPEIGNYFGAKAARVGWLVTGYTAAVTFCSIPMGKLADVKGRRKILQAGLAVFCASSVTAAFAGTLNLLIICRSMQGVGAAMVFSTNNAILAGAFPKEDRGRVLGYSVAATYVGLSAGPVLGGWMNGTFGWKSVFLFTAVFSGASLLFSVFRIPSDAPENSNRKKDAGDGLLKNKLTFVFSNLAALMNYGSTFAVGYIFSVYLQIVAGFDSKTAGLILIIQPVVLAVISPVAGKLSGKFEPHRTATLGMAICAAGIFVCTFAASDGSLLPVLAGLAVTGAGSALFSSPNTNVVMSCVEKHAYGFASSVLSTMRSLGNTLGMMIVTMQVNNYAEGKTLKSLTPELFTELMHTSFVIFAIICTAGITVSLKGKISKK